MEPGPFTQHRSDDRLRQRQGHPLSGCPFKRAATVAPPRDPPRPTRRGPRSSDHPRTALPSHHGASTNCTAASQESARATTSAEKRIALDHTPGTSPGGDTHGRRRRKSTEGASTTATDHPTPSSTGQNRDRPGFTPTSAVGWLTRRSTPDARRNAPTSSREAKQSPPRSRRPPRLPQQQ